MGYKELQSATGLVRLEMNSVEPALLDRHRENFWLSADCTLLESQAVVTRAAQ